MCSNGGQHQGFASVSAHMARESVSANATVTATVSVGTGAGASVGASASEATVTAIGVRAQSQGVWQSSLCAARGFCEWELGCICICECGDGGQHQCQVAEGLRVLVCVWQGNR